MAVNPFAAAAAKSGGTVTKATKKKGDVVVVEDEAVATSINEFVAADAKVKQAKADQEVAKGVVTPFCREEFLRRFASDGRIPETLKFRTKDGNQVTFVVQDRGELYGASDEQVQLLTGLLGEERAEKVILRDMTFEFNNEILNKPGVMEALGAAISAMAESGTITQTEAGNLLVAKSRTTVRKGTLEDLARLCNSDPDVMAQLMEGLGSHTVAYIKA